ncbi:MAG: PorP/SprF family type IX secretion system membrane protein, partial [Bacteroidota bacterium]
DAMRITRLLLFFFLFGGATMMQAQDIHFSQFYASPLTLNPALTGAFEGSFRIGGIYRDQWRSVTDNPFRTPSIFIDAPIVRGFGKNDWVGIGVSLVNDQAGAADLSHLRAMFSVAYHLGFGEKANTMLSLGFQGGFVQKKLDQTALVFQDQLLSGGLQTPSGTSMELMNLTETNINYADYSGGAVLNTYLAPQFNIYVGYALFHFTSPEDAFLNNTPEALAELPMRNLIHGGFNWDFAQKWVLSPRVLWQNQASASEIAGQARFGYHLNTEKTTTLNFGAGYRVDDAAIALLGLTIKGLDVGIAYDFNTSDLNNASNGNGGFEIAASYIAKIYKTPVVKPVLFCPRF